VGLTIFHYIMIFGILNWLYIKQVQCKYNDEYFRFYPSIPLRFSSLLLRLLQRDRIHQLHLWNLCSTSIQLLWFCPYCQSTFILFHTVALRLNVSYSHSSRSMLLHHLLHIPVGLVTNALSFVFMLFHSLSQLLSNYQV